MNSKRVIGGALCTVCLSAALAVHAEMRLLEERNWNTEPIVKTGFIDLGNYVIRLNTFTDPASCTSGIRKTNELYDHGEFVQHSCSAMVTRNSKGEVIFGRNMDEEISQRPAYIIETTYGKYRTIGVTFSHNAFDTYDKVRATNEVDEAYRDMLPFVSVDVMNEKGLYIEVDMRTSYPELANFGLHSQRGETTRSDGTPWAKLRACMSCIPTLAAQNCATVAEVLEFIHNSYDWYTMSIPGSSYSGWNYAFLLGDATGEYGLIEIAQDEVHYIPHQFGHGNYYITPKLVAFDDLGSGYGRLEQITRVIGGIETAEEAMDAMKTVMWRNEVLWIGETYRADAATRPNPYNQIVFVDDQGNPRYDWRSDYVQQNPVLEDGRLLLSRYLYEAAVNATYDPMILQYVEDAISRGTLVVDDGSFTFDVNGETLTLDELRTRAGSGEDAACRDAYNVLLARQNLRWTHDDHNFEAVKALAYAMQHVRTNADGEFDSSAMSRYECLKAYYGYGTEKDEKPLRDKEDVMTTGLNIGVNCAKKEMKVRFWERDDVIYTFRFDDGTYTGDFEPYAADKATTLRGCVYDGDALAGVLELKLGKVNARNGTSRISATVTDLAGKRYTARAVTVEVEEGRPVRVSLEVAKLGPLEVTIGGARFAGSLGGRTVKSAAIGGEAKKAAAFRFVDAMPEAMSGLAIRQDLLPNGEAVEMAGKSWKTAKAAKVGYGKNVKTKQYGWLVKGETNPSGLKLAYKTKDGMFKGTFKAYGIDDKNKLKKFLVDVAGVFVDGKGTGFATEKKSGASWRIVIE